MAYTKNTWKTGDIVSSVKLNHMEDGIEGAYEVMVINDVNNNLDKTWQEIYDAMVQGKLPVIRRDSGTPETGITINIVKSAYIYEGEYTVESDANYSASSATGYPAGAGE